MAVVGKQHLNTPKQIRFYPVRALQAICWSTGINPEQFQSSQKIHAAEAKVSE